MAALTQDCEFEWARLIRLAERHAVRPLLWKRLEANAEGLPLPVRARLTEAAELNARQSLRLTGELLRVLALLEERGVRALPYKGPMLSAEVYGDLGRREFLDLDILIS